MLISEYKLRTNTAQQKVIDAAALSLPRTSHKNLRLVARRRSTEEGISLCLPPSFNLVLVGLADDVDDAAAGAALGLKARAAHATPTLLRVQAAAANHQRHNTILPFACCNARWQKARNAAIKRACSPVIPAWPWPC